MSPKPFNAVENNVKITVYIMLLKNISRNKVKTSNNYFGF